MASLFEQAVGYIREGDIEKGKQLLIEVLKHNQRDENAWLWMTRCVTDLEQKRYCFDRVLKINPQNQHATEGLRRLNRLASSAMQPEVVQEQPVEKQELGATDKVAETEGRQTIFNSVKKFWNSGVVGNVVIGCVSLFLFCCLCSIPLAIFRPNDLTTASTEIVSSLLATPAEIITETVLTTDTPAPTSTPEPAATETVAPLYIPIIPQTALGAACIPDNPPQTGTVIDVVDGDTIKVLLDHDGQMYTVRYIGMDTPESTSQVEYLGAEASAQNAQLVFGKSITLIKDISETDQYGRLLRYVLVDNIFVNYELVAQGYATTASYPPDIACISTFQEAEQAARGSSVGLWSVPPTTAPLPTLDISASNAPCNCSGPGLNCKANFSTHVEAQACYDYCGAQGFGDVFGLDGNDNDGLACETLP